MTQPAAASAGRSSARRAAYRSRWARACSSSPSAATIAAWTGPGTIRPACLRTSSSSATSAGSPVTKPARYPARFERFDSECTASRPSCESPQTSGCSTESGAASQDNSR